MSNVRICTFFQPVLNVGKCAELAIIERKLDVFLVLRKTNLVRNLIFIGSSLINITF